MILRVEDERDRVADIGGHRVWVEGELAVTDLDLDIGSGRGGGGGDGKSC